MVNYYSRATESIVVAAPAPSNFSKIGFKES